MHSGMLGGIAGAVVGLMGGLIGTYFGIRNTTRPHERALAVRLSALYWLWLAAMVAWNLLMPRPWHTAAVMLVSLPLLWIPRLNRSMAQARARDEAGAESNSTCVSQTREMPF